MIEKNIAAQNICQRLADIYCDFSILFLRRKIKIPYFILSVPTVEKQSWTHFWNEEEEMIVKVRTCALSKETILENMLHIFIHMYNMDKGVDDMSFTLKGNYHRRHFQIGAKELGIITKHDKNAGYQIKTIPQMLKEECRNVVNRYYDDLEKNLNIYAGEKKVAKRRKYKVYQCPICMKKIHSLEDLNIICGECQVPYEKVGSSV